MSLAMQHKKRALAKAAAAMPDAKQLEETPTTYVESTVAASLQQDLDRLSALDDVAQKVQLKKMELLPKYLPLVDAYLNSGAYHTNPLIVRVAIWAFDVEDIETAMRLADACIDQQQLAPAYFKRDLPTFFAETLVDWAERQLKEKLSASPWIDQVCERLASNTWPTTNDIVRGKAFKVAGQLAEASGDTKEALAHYLQAQEENNKAGCKGRIEKLQAQLGTPADVN